jgi:hypothetical protein
MNNFVRFTELHVYPLHGALNPVEAEEKTRFE